MHDLRALFKEGLAIAVFFGDESIGYEPTSENAPDQFPYIYIFARSVFFKSVGIITANLLVQSRNYFTKI